MRRVVRRLAELGLCAGLACGTLMAAVVHPAKAQSVEAPVVVELFTSQGCSACPPADALLTELVQDPRVLPLALHVDYWDYIGWADPFAKGAFTARQKAYARAAGRGMIYTPQMIVAGVAEIAGHKPARVHAAIAAERAAAPKVRIALEALRDGTLRVRVEALRALSTPVDVILVRYDPLRETAISRGENAGRVIRNVNVVTDWIVLGTWDGRSSAEFVAPAPRVDRPGAVLVQEQGPGAMLSAARLD